MLNQAGGVRRGRLDLITSTLNPQPYTLHPTPESLHPKPSTSKQAGGVRRGRLDGRRLGRDFEVNRARRGGYGKRVAGRGGLNTPINEPHTLNPTPSLYGPTH